MSENSISNNNAGEVKIIRSREDINSLSNINEKAKSFLNSAFDKLDTSKSDGVLQKEEGAIYVFGDGAISIMKDGKLFAGMSAQGAEAQVIGDVLEVKFSDGAESVMKDDKLVSGKTSTNRAFTKEGDKIVFADDKKADKAPEAKSESKAPKPAVSDSINGVKKQKLDDLANEYFGIIYRDEFSAEDYSKTIDQKNDFYKKNQRIFKKLLGEPAAAKDVKEISTDKYTFSFSPVLNPKTFKYYWELYNVEEIK